MLVLLPRARVFEECWENCLPAWSLPLPNIFCMIAELMKPSAARVVSDALDSQQLECVCTMNQVSLKPSHYCHKDSPGRLRLATCTEWVAAQVEFCVLSFKRCNDCLFPIIRRLSGVNLPASFTDSVSDGCFVFSA